MMTKIFPSRTQAQPVKIIADLDAIISEPIGFKFQGKSFVMKPIDTKAFMKISQGWSRVQNMIKAKGDENSGITLDNVYESYLEFIQPVCEDFNLNVIKKMSLSQINGLVSLMIKHMTGNTAEYARSSEVDQTGEKKKSIA